MDAGQAAGRGGMMRPAGQAETFDLDHFLAVLGDLLSRHLGGDGVVELVGSEAGNINRILRLRYQGRLLGARVALNRRHFRYEKDIIKEVFAILLLYHAGSVLDDDRVRLIVDGLLASPKGSHVAFAAVRSILYYDWSMTDFPFPFFVFEWVAGDALWERPSADRYAEAGRILARLHSNLFEHFYQDIFSIRRQALPWRAHMAAAIAKELEQAKSFGLPERAVARVLALDMNDVRPGRPRLVHNDYSGANILAEPTGGLRIIDWDNWVVDCAELDMMKMKYWTAIGDGGLVVPDAPLFESFLAGYGERSADPLDPARIGAYERLWLLRTFNFESSREAVGRPSGGEGWQRVYPRAAHYRELLLNL